MGNRACSIRHDKIMTNLLISFGVTGVNCFSVYYRSKIIFLDNSKQFMPVFCPENDVLHFRQDLIKEVNI